MQWLNIFYCFINYHFGFIYFLKIANWRQKGKYKNNSAIFLSPKMLQPIILETTLNFIFGLQLSSKWSPNGLLFTSKVVSIWSPMETFSSLPISSQPCRQSQWSKLACTVDYHQKIQKIWILILPIAYCHQCKSISYLSKNLLLILHDVHVTFSRSLPQLLGWNVTFFGNR